MDNEEERMETVALNWLKEERWQKVCFILCTNILSMIMILKFSRNKQSRVFMWWRGVPKLYVNRKGGTSCHTCPNGLFLFTAELLYKNGMVQKYALSFCPDFVITFLCP